MILPVTFLNKSMKDRIDILTYLVYWFMHVFIDNIQSMYLSLSIEVVVSFLMLQQQLCYQTVAYRKPQTVQHMYHHLKLLDTETR